MTEIVVHITYDETEFPLKTSLSKEGPSFFGKSEGSQSQRNRGCVNMTAGDIDGQFALCSLLSAVLARVFWCNVETIWWRRPEVWGTSCSGEIGTIVSQILANFSHSVISEIFT